MTEKEMKAQITQAHTDGYNRGYAKAKAELENKIADIKANCDLAIEGRDVKIKELEKENAELEKNLKLWTDTKDARETIFFQQKRKIAELEKVNAELKTEKGCEICTKFDEVKLTKAKELLKETQGYIENIDDILYDEIEQFLKEIEK